jgi:hypothetical protein
MLAVTSSTFREANQLSATALSRHEPVRLIERRNPSRWQAATQAVELYSAPRSVGKRVSGIGDRPRVVTAAWRASQTSTASWWALIDQPSRCREARSITEARDSQPSSVGIQVTSPHQATSGRSGSNRRPSKSGAGAAP